MRLFRSNFSNSGENNSEKGQNARDPDLAELELTIIKNTVRAGQQLPGTDEMAASQIEGRGDMPDWQSAFTMAPNVRFSRTPENLLSRKQQAEMAPPAPSEPPMAAAPAAQAQPLPSPIPPQPQVPISGLPIPDPHNPGQPMIGARAITYRLKQEFAASHAGEQAAYRQSLPQRPALPPEMARALSQPMQAPARPVQPSLPPVAPSMIYPAPTAQPVPMAPAAPQPRYARPVSLLSDFVFFEALAAETDAVTAEEKAPAVTVTPPAYRPPLRAPVLPAVQQAPVKPPVPQAPPVMPVLLTAVPDFRPNEAAARAALEAAGSVAGLYRAIDVRHAVLPEPAPQAPTEVESLILSPDIEPETTFTQPVASTITVHPVPVFQPVQRPVAAKPVPAEGEYEYPPVDLLQEPKILQTAAVTPEALEQSAGLLESVLEDFGVKGEIIDVRPGPVVTLYEFEPAPGVKSSRVIGLSDDIARSMSALSARVAVIPGRNVIGIELPNPVRETVYFREMIESRDYVESRFQLPVCLGKTIGGEPVIAELAKMPHLLVAGTTGSGKSVAINTMILSLLYRLKPEECRLIMVDPKMLELSVYDGIPHLLTPVVTDPKKAVMALKWAVREMEDRYKKMSRLGVRNIDGYNARVAMARAKGETILCTVQSGFDKTTGEITYEQEEMDLTAMPYIVVIVDEMADLMMVAGKEIEGAIQRLAQMARAAGIHLIMATQRPSVDVITGTIKANFPTRISFQVTSKIDSRTILGEPGAEHLLGQGDMLHMIGGGRIARVHGPFVSDLEVEKVVAHLKTQGRPEYLGTVTEDTEATEEEMEEDAPVFDRSAMGEEDVNDLYEKAVKLVMRDKKCSTSYIQRRLSIGYNRAASLVERMEQEGLVGAANHVGKRAIIAGGRDRDIEVPGMDSDF